MGSVPIFRPNAKKSALRRAKNNTKTLLFSKKPVYFAQVNFDRRNYSSKDLTYTSLNAAQQLAKKKTHAKDLNIEDRI